MLKIEICLMCKLNEHCQHNLDFECNEVYDFFVQNFNKSMIQVIQKENLSLEILNNHKLFSIILFIEKELIKAKERLFDNQNYISNKNFNCIQSLKEIKNYLIKNIF